jgi:hypothetical protein
METLLGLPFRLLCSINRLKKSDWEHSAIFKIATEDFPVLLAPSDSMLPLKVFDRKYPSREIWLSEAEAFASFRCPKILY